MIRVRTYLSTEGNPPQNRWSAFNNTENVGSDEVRIVAPYGALADQRKLRQVCCTHILRCEGDIFVPLSLANLDHSSGLLTVNFPGTTLRGSGSLEGTQFALAESASGQIALFSRYEESEDVSSFCDDFLNSIWRFLAQNGRKISKKYSRISRLWWFIPNIESSYRRFCNQRKEHFRSAGWTPGMALPASTAVGQEGMCTSLAIVSLSEHSRVNMPVDCSNIVARPESYGYFYERATRISSGKTKVLFVSATGAVDRCGRSTHENACTQAESVLNILKRILALAEIPSEGIEILIVYISNSVCEVVAREIEAVVRSFLGPFAPVLLLKADICRSDVLVEIEVTATASAGTLQVVNPIQLLSP